ncbi:tetratricopeptide repeat protein [Actinokineospora bangkokensis]|uniref:Tetratricopeptide repeat protein n=1 Tax=Actinokineospora bangkokensis TaxID=1193682 RepID=A0A1Q9LN89_9PSEU|nr:tetratricopeptide repeat protein [Actinokineospora bangkokensis]OLR93454.1 hypothetical protein BJP25_14185 [Actinokineospora bangkokensis]
MGWLAEAWTRGWGRYAAAAGASVLLATAVWVVLRRRRRRRDRRAVAWERVFAPVRPTRSTEPLWLLSAPVTRLWGWRRERAELVEWCSGTGVSVRVLGGPAGVGKTRLAVAVAEALPRPWSAGWLRRVDGLTGAVRGPSLVLVDDAELRSDLPELLAVVARATVPVRVLLLARDAERLRASLGFGVDAPPVVLSAFGGPTDRVRWYTDAVRAYAKELRTGVPPFGAAGVGADGDTVFLVHARALLAVAHRTDSRSVTARDVAAELLTLETVRWRGAPLPGDDLLAAVAALVAVPAPDPYAGVITLRCLPRFADHPTAALVAVVEWVWQRYPPGTDHRPRLRPMAVAEWLVANHLEPEALTRLTPETAGPVVRLLTRTHQDFPEHVLGLLKHVFTANRGVLDPGLRAVFAVLPGDIAVDAMLAAVVRDAPEVPSLAVEEAPRGFARLRLALAIRQIQVVLADPRADRVDTARAWDLLGMQWRVLGHSADALSSHRKALALWQGAWDRDDAPQGVARSLTAVSDCLADLGDPEGALAAAQDAVAAVERAPDADAPGLLWWVRGTLVERLRYLGRYEEAVDVARRSPASGTRLARAADLDELSVSLDFAGRPDEAVATGRQAIALLRGHDEVSHVAALATVLTSLSDRLDKLGRPAEALSAVEEALAQRRRLRDGIPDLATTLLAVADRLRAAGRAAEALPVADEALGHFRVLVAVDRRTHLRGLGTALALRAECLRAVRRPDDAAGSMRAAVEAGRELAEWNRHRALPHLGAWLHALAGHLLGVREDAEAVKVAEEAVALLRELHEVNREAGIGPLAAALRRSAHCLDRVDRGAEALTALRQSVALWREAASAHPDVHSENYRAALTDLRDHLDAQHTRLPRPER